MITENRRTPAINRIIRGAVLAFAVLLTFLTGMLSVSADGALTVSVAQVPDAVCGESYELQIEITGGTEPYTLALSSGEMPAGLELDAENSRLFGTVSGDPGVYEFTLTVTDAADQTADLPVSLTVLAEMPVTYTVSWDLDGDGTVDETQQYAYGETPYHEDGEKQGDGRTVYDLTGWDKELVPVEEDAVYTAQFQPRAAMYTVSWDFDGDGLSDLDTYYLFGETPVPPHAGKRESSPIYEYVFTGWAPVPATVTADTMYSAVFSMLPILYDVSWDLDGDGLVDQVDQYQYDDMPEEPTPSREKSNVYEYTFEGWSDVIESVSGDKSYFARYSYYPKGQPDAEKLNVSLVVLNRTGEDRKLLIRLFDGNECVAVTAGQVRNDINTNLLLENICPGSYWMLVTEAGTECVLDLQTVQIGKDAADVSVFLATVGRPLHVTADPRTGVRVLGLPASLMTKTFTNGPTGLTAEELAETSTTEIEVSLAYRTSQDVAYRELFTKKANGQTISFYLEYSIAKTDGEVTTVLDATNEKASIVIDLSRLDGLDVENQEIYVYRVALSGVAEEIKTTSNIYGEKFERNGSELILTVRECGIYAIAVEKPAGIIPLWWVLLLVDLIGLAIVILDRYIYHFAYLFRIIISIFMAASIVVVLALKSDVVEIVFAAIGWLLFVLLIINKREGDSEDTREPAKKQ